MSIRSWLLKALVMAVVSLPIAAQHVAAGSGERSGFEMPLADGRVDLCRLMEQLSRSLGMAPPGSPQEPWLVDVKKAAADLRLDELDDLTDGIVRVEVTDQTLKVTIDQQRLAERAEQVRQTVATRWKASFDAGAMPPHGISFVTEADERTPLAKMDPVPQRVVLLVHGVDDPGWMWRDVMAALRMQDAVVARLDYPNDGPISESADLLAAELIKLRAAGVKQVDLVAKSMGGLVCRDVLTRSSHYDGNGDGGDRFPAVGKFIMVGTPNHGSIMARLRSLAEVAEHASRLFGGLDGSLNFECDGCGEAGVDLMPNSDFLRRLNARPLPKNVKMTIIAGRLSPVSEEAASAWGRRMAETADSPQAPPWLKDLASQGSSSDWAGILARGVRGVGDGLVTIDSAKLEGVDDVVIVEGDHLSMVINLVPSSQRIPPAIPVILDRLGADGRAD